MAACLDDEIKEYSNNWLNTYPLVNIKLGKFSAEKSFWMFLNSFTEIHSIKLLYAHIWIQIPISDPLQGDL